MARITVEDCLQRINNRFALIHMASKRVRELRKGEEPTISSKNRDIVVALREIAEDATDKPIPEILLQAQVEPSEKSGDNSINNEDDDKSIEAEGNG